MFFIKFIVFSLINISYESYVQYIFKTNHSEEKDSQNYINSIMENKIYIEIEIGILKQKIPLYIYFNEFPFYIMGSESNIQFIYNEKKSKSYKTLSNEYIKFNIYDHNCLGKYSSEIFYFNSGNNSSKKIDNFPFYLTKSNKKNLPGLIGLKIKSYSDSDNFSFIKQLYNYSIISNKVFSIKYLNDSHGELLIGNFPLLEKNKDNINYALIEIDGNANLWELKFDKILFGNEIIPENRLLFFVLELGVIKAPYIFLSMFEKKFLDKKTCFRILIDRKYTSFYCNKNFSLENFPTLFFYNKELNYTFELNYKDLFYEKDNIYHLLIYFDFQSEFHWKMGKPFLKKYQLIYDIDKRAIGFLINNNNTIYFNYVYFIIIILLLLIIILSIIYFKYLRIKRSKRVNEIEDEFLYMPQD